jgi:hypothetical protein
LNAPARNAPRTVSYSHYIHEILGHAGLCYRTIEQDALRECLSQLKVLVTVGDAELAQETQSALRSWVENGGAWLAIGGVCAQQELFGVATRTREYTGVAWGGHSATLGEGYLQPIETVHPVLTPVPLPLHFFNGVALMPGGARVLARAWNAHQHEDDVIAIAENQVGKGHTFLIAPDLVGSVVRIQQGVAVTRDGVPARDGTGATSDGVLKCDDGIVLDWTFDRQEVPGAPGLRCFLEPVADHWRGLLLRAIFYLAQESDAPLALLWLYPRNLPALAHLSHDSDHNDPALARRLLEVTREERAPATWCVILPGYEPEVITAIKADGHELATHYDAMDHAWGEAEFDRQWKELSKQFGDKPTSNKNHYTRWEGDTEFFAWCQKRGIELDGSKGPSKSGEAGFPFGTCSPYFPVAPDGEVLDVLELPFLSQDLGVFLSSVVVPPFVEGVLRAHGVLHLLFHPSHIARAEVEQSLRNAIRAAREAGMEWWTSRQINDWERARRSMQWTQGAPEETLALRCASPLREATILLLNPQGLNITLNGELQAIEKVCRWQWEFAALVVDLAPGREYRLQVG